MSPLYLNDKDTAKFLGVSFAWFKANVEALERQFGLPREDVALGMRYRPGIEDWARERNTRKEARPERLSETNRGNKNAF